MILFSIKVTPFLYCTSVLILTRIIPSEPNLDPLPRGFKKLKDWDYLWVQHISWSLVLPSIWNHGKLPYLLEAQLCPGSISDSHVDQFLTVYQNWHIDSLPQPSHDKHQIKPDHLNHPNSGCMMKKEDLPRNNHQPPFLTPLLTTPKSAYPHLWSQHPWSHGWSTRGRAIQHHDQQQWQTPQCFGTQSRLWC